MNSMIASEEKLLWSGSPSQVSHLTAYVICGLSFWLIFPIFIIFWKWLGVRTTMYEVTSERVRIRYGFLSRKIKELELYQVKSYSLEQPPTLRLADLGNIKLTTWGHSAPGLTLKAVPNSEALMDQIRLCALECRERREVSDPALEWRQNETEKGNSSSVLYGTFKVIGIILGLTLLYILVFLLYSFWLMIIRLD